MTMAARTRDTVERGIEHRRSGFTLLEVMVAIVLTSLVVLLAYAAAQVAFRVPGVTRWEVQVLAPGASQWMSEWPATTVMPRAVAIGLWHDSEPLGPPLQVVLSPGGPHALSSPEDSFP